MRKTPTSSFSKSFTTSTASRSLNNKMTPHQLRMQGWFDSFDIYGSKISQFNFDGRDSIHSPVGIFCTILTFFFLITFCVSQFTHIFTGYAPNYSVMDDLDMFLTEKDAYPIGQNGFDIGFAVRDIETNEFKGSDKKVAWELHVYEGNGLTNKLVSITDTHICTDDDWSHFYTPSVKSKSVYEQLKFKNVMFCHDKLDRNGKNFNDIKLFGPDDISLNRHIEIVYKPCKSGVKNCLYNQSLKDQRDYIGKPDLMIMYNNERYNKVDYRERSISKESIIKNFQFNSQRPTFLKSHLHRIYLADEVDILTNLGTTDDRYLINLEVEPALIDSAQDDYSSNNYKFLGLQINMKDTQEVINRSNVDLFVFAQDLGGLIEVTMVVIGLFMNTVAAKQFSSLLASRLYIWSIKEIYKPTTNHYTPIKKEQSIAAKVIKSKIANAKYEIPIPKALDLMTLLNHYTCACCCKSKWYKEYDSAISLVDEDMKRNMDLLNFLRRLRMHGLALTSLFEKPLREITAGRAAKKDLDIVQKFHDDQADVIRRNGVKDLWQTYEVLSNQDKQSAAIIAKYKVIREHAFKDNLETGTLTKTAKMGFREAMKRKMNKNLESGLLEKAQNLGNASINSAQVKNQNLNLLGGLHAIQEMASKIRKAPTQNVKASDNIQGEDQTLQVPKRALHDEASTKLGSTLDLLEQSVFAPPSAHDRSDLTKAWTPKRNEDSNIKDKDDIDDLLAEMENDD